MSHILRRERGKVRRREKKGREGKGRNRPPYANSWICP